MIYPIVIYGDEVLRKRCREIGPDYPEVKKLAEDMFLTLEEAEGVGLAAPQIGKDIRLFINTIDHAVDAMKTAGIQAKAEKKETEEYIECTVRIPKNHRVQV